MCHICIFRNERMILPVLERDMRASLLLAPHFPMHTVSTICADVLREIIIYLLTVLRVVCARWTREHQFKIYILMFSICTLSLTHTHTHPHTSANARGLRAYKFVGRYTGPWKQYIYYRLVSPPSPSPSLALLSISLIALLCSLRKYTNLYPNAAHHM